MSKTTQIRHIATGTFHDVPKNIVALGGAETTLWIETKMQKDALEQSMKVAAAEEAARAAHAQVEKTEIDQLKEIVLKQQAQLEHFQQNYVAQAPSDAMTAARDLMAASAHATSLRDSAREEIDVINRFREQHAEEIGAIREMLETGNKLSLEDRRRNRKLMQRAASGDLEASAELNVIATKVGDMSDE